MLELLTSRLKLVLVLTTTHLSIAFDLDANAGATLYNTGTDFIQGAGTTTVQKLGLHPVAGSGGAAATNLIYKFGGTVANLTAGEVIIGVRVFDPMRFSAS